MNTDTDGDEALPVLVGGVLLGHRVMRGGAWFARTASGAEMPARDGAHAAELLRPRARASAQSKGKTRSKAALAADRVPDALRVMQIDHPLVFTVSGAPRTKNQRNTNRHGGRYFGSAAYQRWRRAALRQVPAIRAALRFLGTICAPVDVSAVFYREADVGDEDNFKKPLGDWLQFKRGGAGFIEDDRLIHWTGRTRLEVSDRPRIEVEIAMRSTTR